MRPRLTYANVTATIALFVALGGSSYAAVKFTGRNVVDGSLTTKDVKDRSLLKRDFGPGQLPAGAPGAQGLQGERGLQGVKGENGTDGTDGTDGADGAPGSAVAYALVTSDGFLGQDETKNVDRATRINFGTPTVGLYCLHTTVPFENISATVRGNASPSGEIQVLQVSNINCATGHGPYNVQVNTYDSAGAPADRGFYITFN